MTKHNAHHPKACVERLYLPRAKGGSDLISARDAVEKEVSGLRSYIDKAEEPLLQNVREANLVENLRMMKPPIPVVSRDLIPGETSRSMANFFPLLRANPMKQKEISSGSSVANLRSRLKP